jgi:UDP-N-acetylmuramate dehydrogenase
MEVSAETRLADFTTLGLGGPARRFVDAATPEEAIEAVRAADAEAEPLLVIAGGSNLVVADAGFGGTVVRVAARGVAMERRDDNVRLVVAAGEPWDEVVSRCVTEELAGIECLSGIPGSAGATPIQNVGAYGAETADTMVALQAYDREERAVVDLSAAACGFGYRTSALRHRDRHVVLRVTFELQRAPLSRPLDHVELARSLGVEAGGRAPLAETREAVLALRRRKGMVLDPDDPDSRSAGSFFLNPILSREQFAALDRKVVERLGADVHAPGWPAGDEQVKTSAAWLIQQAGFGRGYGDGRAGISSKHTLALVNRGGATTAELVALAREIRDGVAAAFGVALEPEPTLVGVAL